MNKQQQNNWSDGVLREVLRGIVGDRTLQDVLIFKGARILNLHLQTQRQSLDIDANITLEFQQQKPDQKEQVEWFRGHLERALKNHFEAQERVRYTLKAVKVTPNPDKKQHPQGWNGLRVELDVIDAQSQGVRGLPKLEMDIASPEKLGPGAVVRLSLDESEIQAYALHRIAGEKLRAFLTTLPRYRSKLHSRDRVVRAKDLHDIARILACHPVSDHNFWKSAGQEFRLACESRFVDCDGAVTFKEQWDSTRQAYES